MPSLGWGSSEVLKPFSTVTSWASHLGGEGRAQEEVGVEATRVGFQLGQLCLWLWDMGDAEWPW